MVPVPALDVRVSGLLIVAIRLSNGGGAQAAPVAYVVNGKEYIVNAFGGNFPDRENFPPNPVGDAVIAFILP